ncbi:MAG: TIGR00341 family protein [Flavobacteriales bacterium]|nr:TIGR00341 family protein [Flavobacteriales bacterium]MBK6945941.1 TIGR00341 family protein [Flavobacteriales bacterium]MBK7296692.1 TIGR00341 family protein [Flavobacteriales bacterium]MBP9138250.1 TIGR00341 family protein [Flavobacteriales bacterium]HQV52776.1 TIGR00341 family protein [Flavobacteriales bacterium]
MNWINRILAYLRLGADAEEPSKAMKSIENNAKFNGTNMLILVFAIIIASVGLNVNSAAVVIGAMLISPLMGPIVAVGAGLGVMDLLLVRRSLKNLGFAVGASLITSTLYFMVSPLSEAHSEILARTTPTIWDVLIALAGGFAGIVATASKEKNRGNVVPGVAIATALMPPLCTAGFGLAHLNMPYFFGALYLFTINSVFISISALLTVRWLGYPSVAQKDEKISSRIRRYTTLIVIATVVPSIYLAYRLVGQNVYKTKAEKFIAAECSIPENYLMHQTVDAPNRNISLTYLGNGISEDQEAQLRRRMEPYGIEGTGLEIRTGLSLQELGEEDRKENEGMRTQLDEQRAMLARYNALNDSLGHMTQLHRSLMDEARAMNTNIAWIAIADMPVKHKADSTETFNKVVSIHFKEPPDSLQIAVADRWLEARLQGVKHFTSISSDPPKAGKKK